MNLCYQYVKLYAIAFCTICFPYLNWSAAIGKNKNRGSFDNVLSDIVVDETQRTSDLFDGGPCLACLVMVKYQQKKLKNTTEANKLLKFARRTCVMFGIETPNVCSGGIELFGKQVMEIATRVKIPPKEFCGRLFPDKCAYYKDSLNIREWKVELPPPRKHDEKHKNVKEKHYSKVLQISDLHIDMKYRPESDAECSEPLCCRKPIQTRKEKILKYIPRSWSSTKHYMNKIISKTLTDNYYRSRSAGQWGDYRNCDLPWWTFEHLLQTVSGKRNLHNNVTLPANYEYVIWTGDGIAHDVWSSTKDDVINVSRFITTSIKHHFPQTSIVPVIGNHDSFPSNNFPPSDVPANNYDVSWLYEELADQWRVWLDEDALKTVKVGGFFTTLLPSGLRVISLNTNFCYNLNWWILLEDHDPQNMLQWFVEILRKAEDDGERVHVLGHIPPGRKPDCTMQWAKQYYRIIERFRSIIAGQFFGHTHFDEFQLFYDSKGKPMSIGYLGPSVTPYSEANPAVRIYGTDEAKNVVDYDTFYLDLHKANVEHEQGKEPMWQFEYAAKSAYNFTSISPSSVHTLVSFWRKEYFGNKRVPKTLHLYAKHYSKSRFDGSLSQKKSSATVDSDKPCSDVDCIGRILCDIPKNIDWEECNRI